MEKRKKVYRSLFGWLIFCLLLSFNVSAFAEDEECQYSSEHMIIFQNLGSDRIWKLTNTGGNPDTIELPYGVDKHVWYTDKLVLGKRIMLNGGYWVKGPGETTIIKDDAHWRWINQRTGMASTESVTIGHMNQVVHDGGGVIKVIDSTKKWPCCWRIYMEYR